MGNFQKICGIVCIILLLAIGCSEKKKPDDGKIEHIKLQQEWFPNSNYAGAVFAKYEFAKRFGIDIEILPGSDLIDPIKVVLSNDKIIGDASADRVLMANEKGADLVIIGVVNINSPTCFISKKEKNITTPFDFVNKKVGILTGTNTELIYYALMNNLKIDRKKITEVEIPFDLQTFITNAYDVRPAFIYDEPVSLDLKNIKYNIIEPKNYGIKFLGTVYFTKRENIYKYPELIQSFINAIADGWKAALKYPETAISYVKKFDKSIDSYRELLSLKKGKEYFQGKDGKILFADNEDWVSMRDIMKKMKLIDTLNIMNCFDNSFLNNYYRNEKTNIHIK
jgi:ABC-type nitrate/sulfonate/bicarbonate transport system substrate-binding protein